MTPHADHQLSIDIQIGAGYQPSARLASILAELTTVVREECGEATGDDTAGFELDKSSTKLFGGFTAQLGTDVSRYSVQPRLEKTKTVRM
jgi:hypothetical protein